MTRYEVINRRDGRCIGTYADKQRARNARDRADLSYGAAAHFVREVSARPTPLGAGVSHSDRAGML
jgi:hypothetical protein